MPIPLAIPLIAGAASLGSAYLGSRSASKAAKAQQAALDFEKEKWGAGAAFRNAGTQMLGRKLNPEALTAAYADPGNPYAQGNTYQSPWQDAAPAPTGRQAMPRNPGAMRQPMGGADDGGMGLGGAMPGEDDGQAMMTRRARLEAMAGLLGGPRRRPEMMR